MASVWEPSGSGIVQSNLTRVTQEFTATAAQTTFVLSGGNQYVQGSQNLVVYAQGLLIPPSSVTENADGITIVIPARSNGDKIVAEIFPATAAALATYATQAAASAASAASSAVDAAAALAALSGFSGTVVGSGNLTFAGASQRILGDFTNATIAMRLMFQTVSTNSASSVGILPSGTGTTGGVAAYNNSDPTNAGVGSLTAGTASVAVESGKTGTGTYVPLTFKTSNTEFFRISTTGAFGLSGANYGTAGQVLTSAGSAAAPTWSNPPVGNTYRNKLINGCGWIDQRNGAAAVAVNSTANTFGPDRWAGFGAAAAGIFNIQGNRSLSPASDGQPSCIYTKATTADAAPSAGSTYGIRYVVEGQDVSELRWGSANAKTITLSFWAYSTKTGTHSVALVNSANNRTYVATYTITAASTWEYKTITIAGDTSGTWLTDNSAGIKLFWNLGSGSTATTSTVNAWQAGYYQQATGAQQVIGTVNAELAISAVQLEVGTAATTFEKRPQQIEVALCERYYESQSAAQNFGFACPSTGGYAHVFLIPFRTAKRATASFSWTIGSQVNVTSYGTLTVTDAGASIQVVGTSSTNTTFTVSSVSAAAEL